MRTIEKLREEFGRILAHAERDQRCKRKSVGCGVYVYDTMETICVSSNGPSILEHECSAEVGNCGCMHAEPRAILSAWTTRAAAMAYGEGSPYLLLCTYSPCTFCSNIIIDSGCIEYVMFDILTEHDQRGLELLKMSSVKVASFADIQAQGVEAWS